MLTQARYAVPMLGLTAVAGAFLLARRFRPLRGKSGTAVRVAAALPLIASGTVHLVHPQAFLSLLPPPLPQQSWVIVVTGIPELLGAAGLLLPQTRKPAAVCLAIFMIAIFPANVYVAGKTIGGLYMPEVPTRAIMQAVYILFLLVAGWGVPFGTVKASRHA